MAVLVPAIRPLRVGRAWAGRSRRPGRPSGINGSGSMVLDGPPWSIATIPGFVREGGLGGEA